MEKINIIKVGGAVVENAAALKAFLQSFTALEGHKVLVHGGGRKATDISTRLGIESRMVNGRRITDADTLEVVTMVYGGLVNKGIVAQLQAMGVNALGLTGADMGIILSHRRPVMNGIDYGYVGDVEHVDGNALKALIDTGVTPVIAPLTHDGRGTMLNTNADTMAAETARGLASLYEVTLTFCFEKAGVLADPDDDSTLIKTITPDNFTALLGDGIISGGMIPKIENALAAVRSGVRKVVITSAKSLSDKKSGTIVTL